MWLIILAIINKRTIRWQHLYHININILSKWIGCSIYRSYLILIIHNTCSFTRKVYTSLCTKSKHFLILCKSDITKLYCNINHVRITWIFQCLRQCKHTMASCCWIWVALNHIRANILISLAFISISIMHNAFFKTCCNSKWLISWTRLIWLWYTIISP